MERDKEVPTTESELLETKKQAQQPVIQQPVAISQDFTQVQVLSPWTRGIFGSGWFGDCVYASNCSACVGAEIAESLDKSVCCWFFLYCCCCCFQSCLICSQRGSMRQKFGLQGKYFALFSVNAKSKTKFTLRRHMWRLLISFLLL